MNAKQLLKSKRIFPECDAFGLDLWQYFKTGEAYEIVERDDGLLNSSPAERYFSKPARWPGYAARVLKSAKGKVLDVGCGAGRIALFLQGLGRQVIGIDNSPLAAKVSRLRGVKDARILPIEEIGKFQSREFDAIVMMGHNFGLFGSFAKAKRLLREMHRITSDKAIIIAETNDPYKTHNPDNLEYHKKNLKRGRMAGQLRLRIRHQKVVGPWFDYLLVSKPEMKDIVKGTGWKIDRFVDSKSFRSSTYIAILKKERL